MLHKTSSCCQVMSSRSFQRRTFAYLRHNRPDTFAWRERSFLREFTVCCRVSDGGFCVIGPRVASQVSVDGAVYNQNSFVYDPSRRVGSYIRLAGGANRDADTSRAYVIRASGSVLSKQYSSSLRGNSFDSLHIYPGDTVVIPLNLTKGNTLRTIVSIAQIVGQLRIALSAGNTVF